MRKGEEENDYIPLFETKQGKGRVFYQAYASTVFVGVVSIWAWRILKFPTNSSWCGLLVWGGILMSELWMGLYWIITQSVRWNVVQRRPFKDILSLRYEDKLPAVDIFICTADPKAEPPTLVINTVLSTLAYNYPTQKLTIYLSDDGGSELTFYALLEASHFSKHWLPFCKEFKVEPRSPAAYFARNFVAQDKDLSRRHLAVKKLYEEMKIRIEKAMEKGAVPEDVRNQHNGFLEWNSEVTKQDHQSIVKVLIDGNDPNEVDVDGVQLPTLVYMSREKKPQYHHNFKAGSMNALIRVSSEISNAPIILNVDCDMYSNNSDALRETLCFFMDERNGHEVSYVQYPQNYENVTKNDVYANTSRVTNTIELAGMDGYGATLFCGTGCFHRRESLCGMKYLKDQRPRNFTTSSRTRNKSVFELEESSKVLANCSFEKGTQWGKEMGLIYGCPVEDIVTGLAIQCRGWKPIYYNPDKPAFLGVAPITLDLALVQMKRWSEGMFQIFFSKYCPFTYAHSKIKLGAQMGYCIYLLWAPCSFPVLYYLLFPPLSLLSGVPLFPRLSSLWFLPFAYVFLATTACSLTESIICGDTLKSWWNMQRMWMVRRTTAYLFGFADTIIRHFGFSETTFTVTDKVVDEEVIKRYEEDTIDFGSNSVFYVILSTLAMVNFLCLVNGIAKIVYSSADFEEFIGQISVCLVAVMLSFPVYPALFYRSDKGRLPSTVLFKSFVIASVLCILAVC